MKPTLYFSMLLLIMAVCSVRAQSVQITTTSLTTCTGLPVSLTATATGFTPTRYSWEIKSPYSMSFTSTSPVLSVMAPGSEYVENNPLPDYGYTYGVVVSLTATDSTITQIYSTTLTVHAKQRTYIVGAEEPLCTNQSHYLYAWSCKAMGEIGAYYRWSDSNSPLAVEMVSAINGKVHSLTCAPYGSCPLPGVASVTLTAIHTPPTPTLSASSTLICAGSSATLTATGCDPNLHKVYWPGLPGLGGGAFSVVVIPQQATVYKAFCRAGTNCDGFESSAITVTVLPVPTITVTGLTTVCAGSPIALRGAGCQGGTITWSTGTTGNNLVVSPTQTTTYTARCTKVGSCSALSSPHVVQVLTVPPPTIRASTTALCVLGGLVSLTATGCVGGTVQWSTGHTGSTFARSITQTTTFYATCRAANGCVSPQSKPVVVGVQSLAVSPSTISTNLANPFTLTAVGCVGGTVLWQDPKPGNSTSFVTVGSATAYPVSFTNVRVSGANGFTISSSYSLSATCRIPSCPNLVRTVRVNWFLGGIGARVAATASAETAPLVVGPVPFADELTVWLPDANSPAAVKLLDVSGKAQLTRAVPAGEISVRLATGALSAGVYVVEVWQAERRYVQKVVKQ
jgi:hypothetical protein